MKKIFLLCSFLAAGIGFSLSAQNKIATKGSPRKAAKGTYQFIVSSQRAQVAFAEEIFYEIERVRDEKEVKYLQLGSQAKVKILPFSEINAPGFFPIKEEMVYAD